jgi:type IV secretion system protein VirB1
MLQSFYGRGDPSVGDIVKYDEQVGQAVKRLGKAIATLTIGDGGQGGDVGPATETRQML